MPIYSGFTYQKIVIFHSYVSLPEGIYLAQTNPQASNRFRKQVSKE